MPARWPSTFASGSAATAAARPLRAELGLMYIFLLACPACGHNIGHARPLGSKNVIVSPPLIVFCEEALHEADLSRYLDDELAIGKQPRDDPSNQSSNQPTGREHRHGVVHANQRSPWQSTSSVSTLCAVCVSARRSLLPTTRVCLLLLFWSFHSPDDDPGEDISDALQAQSPQQGRHNERHRYGTIRDLVEKVVRHAVAQAIAAVLRRSLDLTQVCCDLVRIATSVSVI